MCKYISIHRLYKDRFDKYAKCEIFMRNKKGYFWKTRTVSLGLLPKPGSKAPKVAVGLVS